MGTWWRFCGGAGLSYAARSGASGDTDVDSLTVTTPRCGPQLLPVLMERPVPQILDFLCSDLGMTPHRARSTGTPQGGDCGDLCPPLQHVGREGRTQKPLHASCPYPLRWGRGGDKGGPSAPGETLGQPPAGEGPPEQKAGVLLGASTRGAQDAHGPGSSPGSACSRLDLPGPQSPRLQMGGMGWRWTHRPQHESSYCRCPVKRHPWLTQASLVPQASRGT